MDVGRKQPPSFQFYPDEFLGGTQHFTASEVGGYLRLLCHQWKHGSIPCDNLDRIALIMGMSRASAKSAWHVIAPKFTDGRNAKLEKVRVSREQFIQAQSERGRRSAAKRNRGSTGVATTVQPNHQPALQPEGQREPQPESNSPISYLLKDKDEEVKNTSSPKPGELLAVHHRLFIEKYGSKPSYDGAKDAAIAQRLLKQYGLDRSVQLLEAYFASRDPWLSKSGHGMGPLGSSTTINKIIAEVSGRAPRGDGRDWAREWVANG